jgi:hypothetical protein
MTITFVEFVTYKTKLDERLAIASERWRELLNRNNRRSIHPSVVFTDIYYNLEPVTQLLKELGVTGATAYMSGIDRWGDGESIEVPLDLVLPLFEFTDEDPYSTVKLLHYRSMLDELDQRLLTEKKIQEEKDEVARKESDLRVFESLLKKYPELRNNI